MFGIWVHPRIGVVIVVAAAAIGSWVGGSLGGDPLWLRILSGLLGFGVSFLLLRAAYVLVFLLWQKIKGQNGER